jgi:hypothetical protein
MTLPFERTRSVLNTRQFLLELCNPEQTPRVPKTVRSQARALLRHFPNPSDINNVVYGWNENQMIQCPFDKVPE